MAGWIRIPIERWWVLAACVALGSCDSPESPSVDPSFGKATTTTVTVTAAFPDSAGRDTTLNVQVSGTGFDRGSTVAFLLNGVVQPKLRVNSTKFGSSTGLTANLTIAADAPTAHYDIMVTAATGKKGIGTELFTVLPINPIPGMAAVNDADATGDAAGMSCEVKRATCRPVVWKGAGAAIPLPVPAGSCTGSATVINQGGVIAGRNSNCTITLPLKWVPAGGATWTMQPLGTVAGATNYWLWDINEAGVIAGSSYDPVASVHIGAVLWDALGQVRRLSSPFPVTGVSEATGINEAGQAAGYAASAQGYRPVVWLADGQPVALTIPDTAIYGFGLAINDNGVVVGDIGVTNGYRAAIWRPDPSRANAWLPPVYLAPLAGNSRSNAINNAEQVVGELNGQAFYWDAARGAIPLAAWSNRWGGDAHAIGEPTAGSTRIFGRSSPPSNSPNIGSLGVWWPVP